MTKKHKNRKSKNILENKKGVDENVEHILRMIGEESELAESEPDDSGNTLKKSKLSSLVKGFHEDYQYLHKHCKDLISKLENVGHSSTGSDSSDSDSEGDRSDTDVPNQKLDALNEENDWMQKLAGEHQGEEQSTEAEIQKLKQNAEEKTKEISDLMKLLEKAIMDKEATSSDVANLSSENEHLKLLVEGAEKEAAESLKTSTDMENEMRMLSGEKQIVEKERDDLKILIIDLENKREDMSNQLQDTVEKCNSLSSQLEKAHLAEKEVQTLLSELQKSKNENLMLSVECDNLKANEKNVDIKFSELKETLAETRAKNDSLIAENSLLESKLQHLGVEIDGMTVEKEELMNNLNKERGAAEEEKLRVVSEHSKCLNELEQAQCSIKELEKEMESTKLALSDNIAELLKEKNSVASELKQLEASLKNLEHEFEQQLKQISVMQKDNEDLALVNSNLHNELAAVLGEKNEAVASSIDLENKFQQQNQQISSLQETIEGLRAAKAEMSNEVIVHEEAKNAAVAQLDQSEAYVKNLQSEIELKQNEISLFQQANEELQEKNSSLGRQLEEVKTDLQAEIILLQGEKQQIIDDLQQSNTSVKTLERELEQQREQNYILQLANEDLQKNNCNLKKQFEDAMVSRHAEIIVLQDEKRKTLSELQQSEASIKNLRTESDQGREQISILHLVNEEMKNRNASLNKQLEELRSSLSEEIVALSEQKETALSELHQSHASIGNLEIELEKRNASVSVLQQANDDLQKHISALTEEFNEVKAELQKEIKVTQEEKDTVLTQLKQAEFSIKNLESEIAQLKDDLSIQLENNSSLNKQFEESRTNLQGDILALREEKETVLSELHQSEASVRNFERELEKQSQSISALQHANDESEQNKCALTQKLEEVKAESQRKIEVAQEEKDTLVTQLKQSESSIKNLESEIAQLKEELSVQLESNSSLEQQFEEAILKVSNLHEKLERVQAEAACQVIEMNSNAKDLEKIIDILSSQKAKVEGDLKDMVKICMENLSSMNDFEDRVTQKVSDHATKLADLQQSLKDIGGNFQRLHHTYADVSTKASQLEVLKKNHIEQIDQLEEKNAEILDKHRHLEEEMFCANKDNTELQKHVQELEFELQLAKQKLELAEAESKCKEESYVMAVETSKTEIVHLEEQIQLFSGRISLLEETFVQIKDSTESVVSKLENQLDELELHSSQSITCFINRLSACGGEFSVLQNMVHNSLAEQKELLKENEELAIGLRKKEKEMSEMIRSATEAAEKMVQLEKIIEEKDDELAARVQEKREAIKQLSDTIDYHKNNSDDLVRYIRSHNRPRLPFCL
ncbi:COP1-interactive protein 1-like [Triticum dicoccoides]|uniref:COP1-interactive protein 1-like n=1 Tax=Triticum dicoccoides TaxID=85692 RepID=UPI000E795970|nr:COP1-interactive protein 1-like [Triticum dicoccoides]